MEYKSGIDNMDYQKLIEKAEKKATILAGDHYSPRLLYHNINRIKEVVKAAKKIAKYSELSDQDNFILLSASWFFDIGTTCSVIKFENQIVYISAFMAENNVDKSITDRAISLIMATDFEHSPVSLLEEIIKDAITYYYGKKSFANTIEDQRKEIELIRQKELAPHAWLTKNLTLLENHKYHTIYCRQTLDESKNKNISEIRRRIDYSGSNINVSKPINSQKKGSAKGVETIFRIAESNNQRLSIMADNKARILITVNSIILSAVISILLRKLDDNRDLIIPTILLLSVSLASISLSILSTRPSMAQFPSLLKREKPTGANNLLFFGGYHDMTLDAYREGMRSMMESTNDIYDSLIIDVHTEGKVLAKKYRLLRLSYSVFMYGLILATVIFIIAAVIQPPKLSQTDPKPGIHLKSALKQPIIQ
jgi:hypothetical protein